MALSKSEIERYAEDVYKDRLITSSTYCGNCGYNLRTLPYVYTCPECGKEYNARPLIMKGIFAPQDADIPFGDLASAAFCGFSVFIIVRDAFAPPNYWKFAFGLVFFVFALLFLNRAYDKFGVLLKSRRVARRIAMDED